jgi:hypothetical protein
MEHKNMRITSILSGLLMVPLGASAPSPLSPKALEKINHTLSTPVLSSVEGPVLSSVEGPVLSSVEGPVLSSVEGAIPPAQVTLPTPTAKPLNLSTMITEKRLATLINISAVAYASYEIYRYYKKLYYPPLHKPSWREKIASAITPAFVDNMHKHHKLFWYSLGATARALIYKAIAQFMLFCATKTIGDFFELAVQKLKGMIKGTSTRMWHQLYENKKLWR